jgi:alpha-L-fucosidase 2
MSDLFKISRRTALLSGAALPLAGVSTGAEALTVTGSSKDLRLWYAQPASRWEEALPIGNGRFGAMLFGRVGQERLQLNEDTLWAGSPYTPDNQDALAALTDVRKLLFERRFKEATELASARMMAKPLQQMSYGTLGDLLLTFDGAQPPRDYERSLDLQTAVAGTRFTTRRGSIARECFASAADQLIVLRMTASAGERVSFALGYRGPREVHSTAPDYQGSATELVENAKVDWLMAEPIEEDPSGAAVAASADGTLLITGHNKAENGIPAGLTYALLGQVISDGRLHADGRSLTVSGAREVLLLLAAATSYRRYDDTTGDPVAIVRKRIAAASGKTYIALKRAHVAEYRGLFDRFSIDLGQSAAARLPADRRVAQAESADDPALVALYVQYARYLLISSSRPGTQPTNLQGIWNEGTKPPWGGKYTININTEMNYWPADPANLGLCVEPLVRLVEELSVRGAATAKTMYAARGWVAHHNTDLWRAAAPIDGPLWGLWPCGGAWLCNTLYRHHQFSPDQRFLERLYPLMRGSALFFLDTLIEDPEGRGLITSPSLSPEHEHPFGSSLCAGPAMDRQIIRDLFDHTAAAGRKLGRDPELLAQMAAARARLAPDRVGRSGQLQEWLDDWDDAAPEQQHRHVSHLYGLYPSSQINIRDTPALTEAAKVSLRKRGDFATGWATAWRACLWARLGEGDHALAILKGLLGPKRTYPNMFDAHPPFQIDGNFGGAAAIIEMLLQSWGGELRPLAALPKAWPDGAIKGVRAEGGIVADLEWRGGRLKTLLVRGAPRSVHSIRYDGRLWQATLDSKGFYRLDSEFGR